MREHNIGVASVFHVQGYESIGQECRAERVAFLFPDAHVEQLAALRRQFYGGTLSVSAVGYDAQRMYSTRLTSALRGDARATGSAACGEGR